LGILKRGIFLTSTIATLPIIRPKGKDNVYSPPKITYSTHQTIEYLIKAGKRKENLSVSQK
jgi:hypothetical protein